MWTCFLSTMPKALSAPQWWGVGERRQIWDMCRWLAWLGMRRARRLLPVVTDLITQTLSQANPTAITAESTSTPTLSLETVTWVSPMELTSKHRSGGPCWGWAGLGRVGKLQWPSPFGICGVGGRFKAKLWLCEGILSLCEQVATSLTSGRQQHAFRQAPGFHYPAPAPPGFPVKIGEASTLVPLELLWGEWGFLRGQEGCCAQWEEWGGVVPDGFAPPQKFRFPSSTPASPSGNLNGCGEPVPVVRGSPNSQTLPTGSDSSSVSSSQFHQWTRAPPTTPLPGPPTGAREARPWGGRSGPSAPSPPPTAWRPQPRAPAAKISPRYSRPRAATACTGGQQEVPPLRSRQRPCYSYAHPAGRRRAVRIGASGRPRRLHRDHGAATTALAETAPRHHLRSVRSPTINRALTPAYTKAAGRTSPGPPPRPRGKGF